MRNRALRLLFLSPALAALAACGGSGNSPGNDMSQALALPADDTVAAATGSDVLVDVLQNDRSSDGSALTLVSVDGTGAATLRIEGGRVRYRPRCCDLAADEFGYVVRAGNGPTARATVRVAVERVLVLDAAAPELGAAATFAARVGATPLAPASTGAGVARFVVPFRADAALLRLDATRGTAGTLRERLVTIAGDVPALALRAGADGELGAAEWDGLRVSSLSTALAGLLLERHGAMSLPEDGATWGAWLAAPYAVDEWLLRAQLVAHVLGDAGVAFAATDTFSLTASETAVRTLLASLPPGFAAQDRGALFAGAALAAAPAPAGEFWLWRGGADLGDAAAHVVPGTGGSATVITPRGEFPYRIAQAAAAIELVPDAAATALEFERVARQGPICRVGNPIATQESALRAAALRLRPIAIAMRGAEPFAMAVGFDGMALLGFSPSSCATLLSQATRAADRGLRYGAAPVGATLPPAASALGGRTWLLPYCDEPCRAGTPDGPATASRLASFDAATPTLGSFEGAIPVAVADRAGGWQLTIPSNAQASLYAVDARDGVYRAVVEHQPRSLRRSVTETWVAAVDPALGAGVLVGRTIASCCRRWVLEGLRVASATEVVLDGRTYAARIEPDGRTLAFDVPNGGPAPPARLRLTVVARAGPRVLVLVRADGAIEGTAETVLLRE